MYGTTSDASLSDCLGELEVYWGPRLIESRNQWVLEEKIMGRYSSVGITTRYGVDGPESNPGGG